MNQPYIQSEIFRELVSMETLLKDGYNMEIKRPRTGDRFYIGIYKHWKIRNTYDIACVFGDKIYIDDTVKTDAGRIEIINRIWENIPAECKKENIVLL